MIFWILLFIVLTFFYDLLRGIYKNSKEQKELTAVIIEQNKELLKLLSEKDS